MKKRLICVLLEFVLISSVFLNAVLAQSDITKTEDGPVSGLEVIKTGDETPVEEIVGDITVEGKDDVNGIISYGSGASEVQAQNVDVTANSSDNTTYAAGVTSSEEDNIEISGSVSVSAENTASPNEESTYNSSYTDAVGVETNDQSTVTVEENVTVQGEANVETGMDYSSVNTTGVETNNESSATVNGDVTVTTEVNAAPDSGSISVDTTGVETNNESAATGNGNESAVTEVNADSGSDSISADNPGGESNNESDATVNGDVTVTTEVNVEADSGSIRTDTSGVETNNESTATVNGAVTVTTEVNADPGSGYINTETTGVETNNESTATVNGDVTVTTEVNADSGSGYISANTTGVETNNESSVTVEGNVSVTTNIPAENTGYTDTKGIDANGESTATVSGEVNVNVEATFTNTEEGSKYVQTTGIEYDPGTNVSVDSVNVTVDTQGASSTYTRGVSSSYSGSSEETTEVIVNTDITVTSTAEDGSSTAYGIYDSGNSPADFDIDGEISAESNAEKGSATAYGIYESSSESNPDGTGISAAGNVEAKAEGGTDANATGINAYNNSDGPIAIWTEDVVVDVNAENGSASGTGVSANAYDNGHVNVNAANIDVTVVGNAEEEKFTRTYTVYPGTSSPDEAHSGETTVIVRNDITVEAESSTLQANATGIRASSSGNPEPQENNGDGNTGSQEPYEVTREYTRVVSGTGVSASGTNTNVEVEGDITVTADSDRGTAVGIYAYSNNDGITIVDAGGSIMVSTSDADLNKDNTEAIYAAVYGSGTVDITVGKDENVDQHGIITEGGNIVSDGNGIIVQTDGDATGSVEIEVKGDVTAENHGLEINTHSDEAVADIIVNGTLSGKEASIVIGGQTTADNVQLTLWKVDLTEVEGEQQQHAVTQEIYVKNEETQQIEKEQFVTEETKKIEENIRYIIKIEKNKNAELGVEGTEKVDDYDTAKEGDNVIFKVSPKEGFQVKAAYNGLGERVPLAKDAAGNYFVIVARGGGVYLSVELDGGTQEQPPVISPAEQPIEETIKQNEEINNEERIYRPGTSESVIVPIVSSVTYNDLDQVTQPKKITNKDKDEYYELLLEAIDEKKNPLNENRIEAILRQKFYWDFTKDQTNWILEALRKADEPYRSLYLLSLFDYEINGREQYIKNNPEKSSAYYLRFDDTIHIDYDFSMNSNKTTFTTTFFHESGHALDITLRSFWKITDHKAFVESSKYSEIEFAIQDALETDVRNRLKTEFDNFSAKLWDIQYWEQVKAILKEIKEPSNEQLSKLDQASNNYNYYKSIIEHYEEDSYESISAKWNMDSSLEDFVELLNQIYGTTFSPYDSILLIPIQKQLLFDSFFDPLDPSENTFILVPNSLATHENATELTVYYKMLQKIFLQPPDYIYSNPNYANNDCMIMDVYGGVTNNKFQISFGHASKNYWYDVNGDPTYNQLDEAWAEFFSAKLLKTAMVQKNEDYFPKATKELDKLAQSLRDYYKEYYSKKYTK